MIRNVLIATYILAVLAISAIARAQFVKDDSNTAKVSGNVLLSLDSKVMVTN